MGTVLIVDDNEDSIAAVRTLFELCGVTVVAAAFESAKNPTCAFAGIAVDVRPTVVHV